jgi:threonine synthase
MGPVVMAELERIARQENLQLTITTHAHNPEGMRGADGIGREIAAQVAGLTHLYVPVGGGGLLVATARGLARAGSGAAVVACQPAGCAPVVGVLDGRLSQPVVDACDTDVSGLQLPEPPDGMAAVQAVRTSGGWGTAVSDEQVLRAQDLLTTVEGVFVEPAAAVALAALLQDRRAGRLDSSATAAVVLSGNGLKDLRRFRSPDGATREADVDDLAGIVTAHLASREQGSAE